MAQDDVLVEHRTDGEATSRAGARDRGAPRTRRETPDPRRRSARDVPIGLNGERLWWRRTGHRADAPASARASSPPASSVRASSVRASTVGAWSVSGPWAAGSTTEDPSDPAESLSATLAELAGTVAGLATDCPTWSLPEREVGEAIGQAHRLHEVAQALVAVLCREADERGLGLDDGLSRPDWLRTRAPGLEGPTAARFALVGAALRESRWAHLGVKVADGSTTVDHAAAIIRFEQDVERVCDRDHLDAVVTGLVEHVDVLTVKELTRLISHARASLRPPSEVDAEDRGRRAGRALTRVRSCAGMAEYRLRLDSEGAAILDAAIDPLARPRPDLDWDGDEKRDPRTPATRRADALIEIVGRAVSAPEGVPRTERAKLVVTLSYEALLGTVRGAGVAADDEVLSPGTIRRLACNAGIISVVLGGPSEVLDVGREERFFTRAQRLALALRDGGCTFPGCTVPPQWCEGHHVRSWLDGGATDLTNGALLCGRHHTVVHERALTATVVGSGVRWHV